MQVFGAAWLYPLAGHGQEKRTVKGEFSGILAEGVIKPENLEEGLTFAELTYSLRNGAAYVNVHTEEYFMGAIRGQVYAQEFAGHMEMLPAAAGDSK